jgi:hypothetical protein
MKNRLYLISLLTLFWLSSCNEAETELKGEFEFGTFIVNEGAFGQGNGTLSFLDSQQGNLVSDAFRDVNGFFAGDVFQDMHIDGDKAYIVLNGSGIVRVLNSHTLAQQDIWDDANHLLNPRRVATSSNQVLVTNWGDFDENFNLSNSWLSVFDKNSGNFIQKIALPAGPEGVWVNGARAFVACSNFGNNNQLVVINLSNLSIEKTLELPNGPFTMREDKNGDIWVLCQAGWGVDEGHLVKIDGVSLSVSSTFQITPKPGNYIAMDAAKEQLYYYIGRAVYKMDISANSLPSSVHVTSAETISGIGVNPTTSELYLCHTPDFASIGQVLVYGTNQRFRKQVDVGIAPHMVLFK